MSLSALLNSSLVSSNWFLPKSLCGSSVNSESDGGSSSQSGGRDWMDFCEVAADDGMRVDVNFRV